MRMHVCQRRQNNIKINSGRFKDQITTYYYDIFIFFLDNPQNIVLLFELAKTFVNIYTRITISIVTVQCKKYNTDHPYSIIEHIFFFFDLNNGSPLFLLLLLFANKRR